MLNKGKVRINYNVYYKKFKFTLYKYNFKILFETVF